MQRIAAPMVGGMLSAPLLSMLLLPAAFELIERRRLPQAWGRRSPALRRASNQWLRCSCHFNDPSRLQLPWSASAGSRARVTFKRNGMPPSSNKPYRPPPSLRGRPKPPSKWSRSTSTAFASSARRATPSSRRFPPMCPFKPMLLALSHVALCTCPTRLALTPRPRPDSSPPAAFPAARSETTAY